MIQKAYCGKLSYLTNTAETRFALSTITHKKKSILQLWNLTHVPNALSVERAVHFQQLRNQGKYSLKNEAGKKNANRVEQSWKEICIIIIPNRRNTINSNVLGRQRGSSITAAYFSWKTPISKAPLKPMSPLF